MLKYCKISFISKFEFILTCVRVLERPTGTRYCLPSWFLNLTRNTLPLMVTSGDLRELVVMIIL